MNKYEKQINELKKQYDKSYDEYVQAMNRAYSVANKHCQAYNTQINRINTSRDNLLDGISILYKFLKNYGNIAKKISAFDYATETQYTVDKDIYFSTRFENDHYTTSGFVKTASVTAMVAAPIVLPAIWAGDALAKRAKDKKEFARMTEEYEKEKTKWDNAIKEKEGEAKFYKDASEIAFLYQTLILTVRQAIKETILPELVGIEAFLVADAIKNSIISDMDPNDAEISKIDLYKGTIYDCHYTFVMNTFDYYNTIVKIFTTPILTNIVSDDQVTDEEKRDFESKCKMIEAKTQELAHIAVFGGEN